ncbi:MAG: hypothetical protein Q8L08_07075 [Candidatus Nanopelagicaceae bacterium]|nr:hypothetical protein [Candidatus Nanopelagicaceae bacterium]
MRKSAFLILPIFALLLSSCGVSSSGVNEGSTLLVEYEKCLEHETLIQMQLVARGVRDDNFNFPKEDVMFPATLKECAEYRP